MTCSHVASLRTAGMLRKQVAGTDVQTQGHGFGELELRKSKNQRKLKRFFVCLFVFSRWLCFL